MKVPKPHPTPSKEGAPAPRSGTESPKAPAQLENEEPQLKGPRKDALLASITNEVADLEAAEFARRTQASAPGKIREEDEMVLDDEDAMTRDTKSKQNRRQIVARDRFTVDKDAPELLRRRALWKRASEDNEDEGEDEPGAWEEPEELDLEELGERIAAASDEAPLDRAALFEKRSLPAIGDPALTEPRAIMTAFGSPHAYAKHVMILAEAFRSATGAHRHEAVSYLALLFVAVPDRAFGRAALRELNTSTGIIDLYPLEVVEHILVHYPGFLSKFAFGRLFFRDAFSMSPILKLRTGQERPLDYDERTRIRGFALKGGPRPGYAFWPAREDGRYLFRIDHPGRYDLIVSGVNETGLTLVDILHAEVEGEGSSTLAPPSGPERVRNPERIAAWPMPNPVRIDPRELMSSSAGVGSSSLLDATELGRRQQIDALKGPKGNSGTFPAVGGTEVFAPPDQPPKSEEAETTEPELRAAVPLGPVPRMPLGHDDEEDDFDETESPFRASPISIDEDDPD